MPPPSTTTLPVWLQRALGDHVYLDKAIEVLGAREVVRENARIATRHSSDKQGRRRSQLRNPFSSRVPKQLTEHYSVEIGSRQRNLYENRYHAIEPYDRTRVVVGPSSDPGSGGRYLNGDWVRELYGGRWWIATQAPLPNTAHAFLSIFMQSESRPPTHLAPTDSFPPGPCRIRTAVQLTRSNEGGRTKAHPYFPTEIGQSFVVPPPDGTSVPALKITLEAQREVPLACCVQSTIRLAQCKESGSEPDTLRHTKVDEIGDAVRFTHLLFTHWPDFGVPEGPDEKASLLAFARLVETVNSAPPPSVSKTPVHPAPPITVNCSAGIGRTGSFIALTSLLRAHGQLVLGRPRTSPGDFPHLPPSPQGPLPDELSADEVAAEIDMLREQRPAMVQRPEQQVLVYELLAAVYHEAEARAQSDS
ncbi:hypothetical protein M0805_000212 [Coniferiporia weirii]|nr:hypothetical protein M0805_000212 [Coniferiporia weirii]